MPSSSALEITIALLHHAQPANAGVGNERAACTVLASIPGLAETATKAAEAFEVTSLDDVDDVVEIIRDPVNVSQISRRLHRLTTRTCCLSLPNAGRAWEGAAIDQGISDRVNLRTPILNAWAPITCN